MITPHGSWFATSSDKMPETSKDKASAIRSDAALRCTALTDNGTKTASYISLDNDLFANNPA